MRHGKDESPYHVYPLGDDREHDLVGQSCWCGPRLETEDPLTGMEMRAPLVIHRDRSQRAGDTN